MSHPSTDKEKKLKYIRVYDRLYELIQNGTYPPGSQLPSETVLAEQMQVSRMTLRKALLLLQEDELIRNQNGVGRFVKEALPKASVLGMETVGHPLRRCCIQDLDQVEIDLHLEPPNGYITKCLHQKSPAVVIADRWYKHQGTPRAYTLSFLPIERIGQEGIDLNQPESLLRYLEEEVYESCRSVSTVFSHSSTGNFSATRYSLSQEASFLLIQETIYGENQEVMVASKHYIPMDLFRMELHIDRKENN